MSRDSQTPYTGPIKLVVMDLGGTVNDGPQDLSHLFPNDDGMGVKTPIITFEKIFNKYNMDVDWDTMRKPLGVFKRDHLHEILKLPAAAAEFKKAQGREWSEDDLDDMFAQFRELVVEVALTDEIIRPIDGCKECIDQLRSAGIIVGCDTGFPKEAYDAIYAELAKTHGIEFDVTSDSENVRGRPSPFLVYDCMDKANVYPAEAVVKGDDIEAGLHEGRNSGAWTVGFYASGTHDYERLQKARPDYLIPSVKYLPEIIFGEIQPRLLRGERPG